MECIISEKEFIENSIEVAQKAIWELKTEDRVLNRMKLQMSGDQTIQAENRLKQLKGLLNFVEKKIEVLKDRYEEITKERITIKTG